MRGDGIRWNVLNSWKSRININISGIICRAENKLWRSLKFDNLGKSPYLNVKVLKGTFNQKKALVGPFSVIWNLSGPSFPALINISGIKSTLDLVHIHGSLLNLPQLYLPLTLIPLNLHFKATSGKHCIIGPQTFTATAKFIYVQTMKFKEQKVYTVSGLKLFRNHWCCFLCTSTYLYCCISNMDTEDSSHSDARR